MSLRLLSLGRLPGIVACCCLLPNWGWAQEKQPPARNLEAPEPTRAPAATNSVPAPPKKDSLQQLEESLNRSLRFFSPKGPLDGMLAPEPVLPPPPVQVVPNRRAVQQQERRKNWMSLTPEEMMQGPESDLLKLSETGADSQKKSALDQFYERLNWERSGNAKSRAPKEDNGTASRSRPADIDIFASPDDDNLPANVRESAKKLKEEVSSEKRRSIFDTSSTRNIFADFFGPGDKSLSPEQVKAHKEYLERYRELLQGPTPSPLANPLTPLGPTATPLQPTPYGGLNSFATAPAHRSWGANPDGFNPALNPGKIQDVNATVLNQWNPLYAPPRLEPAKPPPLAVPPAEAPRRKFF